MNQNNNDRNDSNSEVAQIYLDWTYAEFEQIRGRLVRTLDPAQRIRKESQS